MSYKTFCDENMVTRKKPGYAEKHGYAEMRRVGILTSTM